MACVRIHLLKHLLLSVVKLHDCAASRVVLRGGRGSRRHLLRLLRRGHLGLNLPLLLFQLVLHLLFIELIVELLLRVPRLMVLTLRREHAAVVLQHFIIQLVLRAQAYAIERQLLQHDLIAYWVNTAAIWWHGSGHVTCSRNLRIQIDGHVRHFLTRIDYPLN